MKHIAKHVKLVSSGSNGAHAAFEIKRQRQVGHITQLLLCCPHSDVNLWIDKERTFQDTETQILDAKSVLDVANSLFRL